MKSTQCSHCWSRTSGEATRYCVSITQIETRTMFLHARASRSFSTCATSLSARSRGSRTIRCHSVTTCKRTTSWLDRCAQCSKATRSKCWRRWRRTVKTSRSPGVARHRLGASAPRMSRYSLSQKLKLTMQSMTTQGGALLVKWLTFGSKKLRR